MKKGRHRRFEEARSMKRSTLDVSRLSLDLDREPPRPQGEDCAECGAPAGTAHASWCLAEVEEVEVVETPTGGNGVQSRKPAPEPGER